jgi:hypothetical protein
MSLLPVLALLLASGMAAGLLVQWLAVLTGVQSSERRNFISAGLIGALGAAGGIPLSALLDYARGGPGELSRELTLSGAIPMAIFLSFSWVMSRNLNRVQRAFVAIGIISAIAAVLIVIALTVYIES